MLKVRAAVETLPPEIVRGGCIGTGEWIIMLAAGAAGQLELELFDWELHREGTPPASFLFVQLM